MSIRDYQFLFQKTQVNKKMAIEQPKPGELTHEATYSYRLCINNSPAIGPFFNFKSNLHPTSN